MKTLRRKWRPNTVQPKVLCDGRRGEQYLHALSLCSLYTPYVYTNLCIHQPMYTPTCVYNLRCYIPCDVVDYSRDDEAFGYGSLWRMQCFVCLSVVGRIRIAMVNENHRHPRVTSIKLFDASCYALISRVCQRRLTPSILEVTVDTWILQ